MRWWSVWSWSDVITPWDVKQYTYCPLIPWIARNYSVSEPETYGMLWGREERAARLEKLERFNLKPPLRFDVHLYNPKLRMAGIADAVAGEKRYTVVEVKAFTRKQFNHFRAQLMAYALLCETYLGPTQTALLLLGDKAHAWDVTRETLSETERLALKVRETIESERPPPTQPNPKCASCWYRRLCPNW